MKDFSVLIGGKAGFGIDKAGFVIAGLLSRLGYRIYVYRDYPSIIRGGHTFSIIRASEEKIAAHTNKVDAILALNQETIDIHKDKLKNGGTILSDAVLSLDQIMKEEKAPEITRNICMVGALCKTMGMELEILNDEIKNNFTKETELNLKVARRGYDAAKAAVKIERLDRKILPLVTSNEAMSMGLVKAGLKSYIAYPMTPTSPILHFLAANAEKYSIKVVHPENEIAVILTALGFSYCGEKSAVGTSGGGFCLMTEGLSFAGMAELPVLIILGQRPGPSTGLPTYSCQTELHFALNAGQGEFPRFIVAPADAEDAFYWSQVALNMAWKYQIPSIILSDKDMGEGTYSFDEGSVKSVKEEKPPAWDRKAPYKRYQHTATGVSPLAFVPDKDAIVKVNSYEHDEYGITTESPVETKKMRDKVLGKMKYIEKDLEAYETVKVYGKKDSKSVILCWGSNKGVCVEAGNDLGLKVVHLSVMWPFPLKKLKEALKGAEKIIAVENNATAQLVTLMNRFGLDTDEKILKYDGRPFSLDELENNLKGIVK